MKDLQPFYAHSKAIKDHGTLKTIPNAGKALTPTKNIEPARINKRKRLTVQNPFYCRLKELGETGKKFVLDENVAANSYQNDIKNVINSKSFCEKIGLENGIGINDKLLLKLAMENQRIIVTKDRGLVLRSLKKNYPIVYVEHRKSLIYIDSVRLDFK